MLWVVSCPGGSRLRLLLDGHGSRKRRLRGGLERLLLRQLRLRLLHLHMLHLLRLLLELLLLLLLRLLLLLVRELVGVVHDVARGGRGRPG